MELKEEIIDIQNWDRKEHLELFNSNEALPFYTITVNLDVTNVYHYSKQNNFSFYATMIYIVANEMKKIKNYRYRLRDNQVILLNDLIPGFTFIPKDSENFKIGIIDANQTLQSFNDTYKEIVETQKELLPKVDFSLEYLIQISCVPWINYSSVDLEVNLMHDDCVPRVVWGKLINTDGKYTIQFSVQVNHKMVDAIHVGMLINNLEQKIGEMN